jgi:hypothetical protein
MGFLVSQNKLNIMTGILVFLLVFPQKYNLKWRKQYVEVMAVLM